MRKNSGGSSRQQLKQMFKVDLLGVPEFSGKMQNLAKKKAEEIDFEIEASMKEMKLGSQQAAPKDQGILVSEISYRQVSSLNWELVSAALYSAWLEFGTRSQVVIPAGLEQVAAEARGARGGSTGAKEMIFKWCERHGIERRAWYAIFIKIMTRGIKPHPFFFKQLQIEQPNLIRNVKARLNG